MAAKILISILLKKKYGWDWQTAVVNSHLELLTMHRSLPKSLLLLNIKTPGPHARGAGLESPRTEPVVCTLKKRGST